MPTTFTIRCRKRFKQSCFFSLGTALILAMTSVFFLGAIACAAQAEIGWEQVDPATGYKVYYGNQSGFNSAERKSQFIMPIPAAPHL